MCVWVWRPDKKKRPVNEKKKINFKGSDQSQSNWLAVRVFMNTEWMTKKFKRVLKSYCSICLWRNEVVSRNNFESCESIRSEILSHVSPRMQNYLLGNILKNCSVCCGSNLPVACSCVPKTNETFCRTCKYPDGVSEVSNITCKIWAWGRCSLKSRVFESMWPMSIPLLCSLFCVNELFQESNLRIRM